MPAGTRPEVGAPQAPPADGLKGSFLTIVDGQPDQRLLLTVEEVARRLGIGRTMAFGLVHSGQIESVCIGRLRRVPVDALDRYVQRARPARVQGLRVTTQQEEGSAIT